MIKKIHFVAGKKYTKRLVLIAFLLVIISVIDTALTYIVLPFVSLVTGEKTNNINSGYYFKYCFIHIETKNQAIALLAFAIASMYIFRNIFVIIVNRYRYRILGECKGYISTRIFNAVTRQPYYYFTETNTSSIQRICINDVSRTFSVIDSLMTVVNNALTLGLIVALLLKNNWVLTVVAIVCVAFVTIVVNRPIVKKVSKLSALYTKHYTSMLQYCQEFVGSLKSVITTRSQNYFVNYFSYYSGEFTKNEAKYGYLSSMPGYIMNAVIMGLVFGYTGILALLGESLAEQIPVLALFAMAALKIMPSATSLITYYNNIRYNRAGLNSIYDYISSMEHNESKDKTEYIKDNNITNERKNELNHGIILNNVDFHFYDSDRNLFENVNLSIPANRSVAFIGTTGSGKTTLADIILGLHIPQNGEITVDGIDIHKNPEWWAKCIGYIPQTIYMCENTIRANVAFCVDEDKIDDKIVRECLEKARILDFVEKMPDGIYTVTGENGVKLSGGQRQRIGIARALYNNPSFLVFDEATSALDNSTEQAIMDTINRFKGEKTILIIAHRLSTIEKCDIVYRIENGVITKVKG